MPIRRELSVKYHLVKWFLKLEASWASMTFKLTVWLAEQQAERHKLGKKL